MSSSLDSFIAECENLVRGGQGVLVRMRLRKLAGTKISRKDRAVLASLAWRVNLPEIGLRWLGPFVRPDRKHPRQATPQERTEYAACLIRIGAVEEASNILNETNPGLVPRVWLLRAFALISQWNYGSAIEPLQQYTRAPQVPDYQRMVGKVNLAEALVHERKYLEAETLLAELLQHARDNGLQLVEGKVLELSAQSLITQRRIHEAKKVLNQARTLLSQTEGLDQFFVEKWQCFASFLERGDNSGSRHELALFRKVAATRRHWETVRDCDRLLAIEHVDKELLTHVYFGTPYPAFRKLLLSDFPSDFQLADSYCWRVGPNGRNPVCLDLANGGGSKQKLALKPGSLPWRLLCTLASDFYRPFRLASLFYRLYPQEHFNPSSSRSRVYEAVLRLNHWFAAREVPLCVVNEARQYALKASGSIRLIVCAEPHRLDRLSCVLRVLEDLGLANAFTALELSNAVRISRRSAQILLDQAIHLGTVERLGRGRATCYRLFKTKST